MKAGTRTAWVLGFAVWLACGVLCGCSNSEQQSVRLVPSTRAFEPDIPIPAGFELVDGASEDRSTGTSRLYLRHLYMGKADKYAVRNFYREQMPLARWIKVSEGNVRGVCSFRFEKGNESCTLEIRDTERRFSRRTQIQVLVSQEQRGSKKPKDERMVRNQ
jgi:hypothetical protein